MFYALATKKIRSRLFELRHVLEDIESLNRKAIAGLYEFTAVSYHAYPYLAGKYVLMETGSSVGDGYGPVLIATRPVGPEEIRGKRVAVPGKMTTAYLALKIFQPDFLPVETPFDAVQEAVRDRAVDFGLLIHEGQLTFDRGGFYNVLDLGRWWKQQYGLPLPLGANALLRSLSDKVRAECCRLMRESIQYALEHREEALNYALQFARNLDPVLAEKFIGMYVNHHTLHGGEDVRQAAQKLLDLGNEAGVIPHRVEIEFAR